jgi:hypothetical protein
VKVVDYYLGAGPHVAARIERDDGTVEIRMFDSGIIVDHRRPTATTVIGHGNTAREAAAHLADQLREIARLVEAHEGDQHR